LLCQEQVDDDDFGGMLARTLSGSEAAGNLSGVLAITAQNQEALSVLIKVAVLRFIFLPLDDRL
jgi:hypothetical protein